jgi:hypothetical protein
MAKHGTWTVIFGDQMVIKRTGEFTAATAKGYQVGGTDFWSQQKFSGLHAIQFTDDGVDNDQVEYTDNRDNTAYDAETLGDFSQFTNLWDSYHLSVLQENWDDDNVEGETEAEKITRLGARPTTYSS